jgi:hypothetical protein
MKSALGTLVVCLNSGDDDGLLAVNPALRVHDKKRSRHACASRQASGRVDGFRRRASQFRTLNGWGSSEAVWACER